MYNFIQKLAARVLNSNLVLHNPYLNWAEFIELSQKQIIGSLYKKFIHGPGTVLYPGAQIENHQHNPQAIQVGADCHLRGELLVFAYAGQITIGREVFLGQHSRIWSAEKVSIGSFVLISHQVNISDTNSHETDHQERAEGFRQLISKGHTRTKPNIATAPVTIEDHVWISANVTILKGITIGKGAIIAAGSVVTEDVEAFTLVAGNPARFVKKLS